MKKIIMFLVSIQLLITNITSIYAIEEPDVVSSEDTVQITTQPIDEVGNEHVIEDNSEELEKLNQNNVIEESQMTNEVLIEGNSNGSEDNGEVIESTPDIQVIEDVIEEDTEEKQDISITSNIMSMDIDELVGRIENNENLFVLIGKYNNEYQEVLVTISELYNQFSDNIKSHILTINQESDNYEKLDKYIDLEYKDKLDFMKNNKSEANAIVTTYNGMINKIVILNEGKSETLDWKTVAKKELSLCMNVLELQVNEISTYGAMQSTWLYHAKPSLQRFTADISGNYQITLWGADGDSDMGAKAHGVNSETLKHTTGIGGQGGITSGVVHLNKGDSIYLALGQRNNMTERRSYNGGGKGFGARYSYRAGGGGAASVYSTIRGNGEIANYENNQDEIIMIAGGGGGSEDMFAPAHQVYYCNLNPCITSIGGAGGPSPTGGISSGPTGIGGGYLFGIGQDYASYENASSGAGGGGFFGGTSANNPTNVLKGGTGGGGLSYINNDIVTQGNMITKDPLIYTWQNDDFGWDNGENAKAAIEFIEADKYTLKINYLDINNNEKLVPSFEQKISVEEEYSIETPTINGYTITDESLLTIKGKMPEQDVEINVYFDYSKLIIRYLDLETKEVLSPNIETRLKIGENYEYRSPDIKDYEIYDDIDLVVKGIKKEFDETYDVYYVKKIDPFKDIIEVNGLPVSKESSDKGIELKHNDIITYQITLTNKRNVDVTKTIEDKLVENLIFMEVLGDDEYTFENNIITWKVKLAKNSVKHLQFKAKVVAKDNLNTVDNWTRKDPFIKLEVIKDANPKNDNYVGYGQEIDYEIRVKNQGKNVVSNIVVIDEIPKYTEFVSADHDYQGVYNKDRNYVKFIIDKIKPSQVIKLKFKVKVTEKVESNENKKIENYAKYFNFTNKQEITDNTNDSFIIENGYKTNIVVHKIDSVKFDIHKSADPKAMSIVSPGEQIAYNIKITNTGNVKANYIRITDDIPTDTTYIENSLSLVSENVEANDKYAVTYGENFDIAYDTTNKCFMIKNLRDTVSSANKQINKVELTYPEGIKVNNDTKLDSNWSVDKTNTKLTLYTNKGSKEFGKVRDFITRLRFSGEYGLNGSIGINYYVEDNSQVGFNKVFNFSSNIEKYVVEMNGVYLLETWGAQGGNNTVNGTYYGGKGGYSKGEIVLNKGTEIYVCVGGAGSPATSWGSSYGSRWSGGYNGGGNGKSQHYDYYGSGDALGAGGGATHIATRNGLLRNLSKSDLLIVSGGGGGAARCLLTGAAANGGSGGGLNGSSGTNNQSSWSKGGTQTSAGDGGGFGYGGTGSGGGLFGGGHGSSGNGLASGGGGSGYVAKLKNASSTNGVRNGDGMAKITLIETTDVIKYSEISSKLPTPSSSGGCKYITDNGSPYVECISADLGVGQSVILKFSVKVNENVANDKIENVAKYEKYWNDIGLAGDIKTKPENETNTVVHPLNGKVPKIVGSKEAIPTSGSFVDISDTITYQIKIRNTGDKKANYVVVREYIPEYTTYKDASIDNNGIYISGKKPYVEWVLNDIEVNEERVVEYQVDVDDNIPLKHQIIRSANYEMYYAYPGNAGEIEKEPINNTNETLHKLYPQNVEEESKIIVTKDANFKNGLEIHRGETIKYVLKVENQAEYATSRYITVRDYIPKGTKFIKFMEYESNDESVNIKEEYVESEKPYVEWVINMLKAGKYVNLKFEVEVEKETLENQIVNKGIYGETISPPTVSDKNEILKNETNTIINPILEPNVKIVKKANPDNENIVGVNSTIEYILEVHNDSLTMANYLLVEDKISDKLNIVNYSIETENDKDEIILLEDKHTIRCKLYDLKADETRKIIIKSVVNDSVKQGEVIINKGYYDVYTKDPGDIENDNIEKFSKETNEIIHFVDMNIDKLSAGGRGWKKVGQFISLIILVVGVLMVKKGGGKI